MQGASQSSLEQFLGTPTAQGAQPQVSVSSAPQTGSSLEAYLGTPNPQMMAQNQATQSAGIQYPKNGPVNQAINNAVPALQNIPLVGNTAADMARGYQATGMPLPMSLMQGVGQGVQSALSGASHLYNDVPGGIKLGLGLPQTAPNIPNPQMLQNPISPATAFTGNMASSIMMPGDIGLASKAASLAPKLPGVVNALAPMADRAAIGAGYGALYGSANGNTPTAGNIALSAAMPAFAPYAIQGVQSLLNGNALKSIARPIANYMMGNLQSRGLSRGSPLLNPANVPVQQNAIGSTPASIGEFINSPKLTGEYNKATQQPFSDQDQAMQNKLQDVKDSGNSIMRNLLGNTDPAEINSTILNNIQNNQENWGGPNGIAQSKFGVANQFADQVNFNSSNRPLTQTSAQSLVDGAALSAKKNEPNWLNESPNDLNFIKQLAQGPTGGATPSTLNDAIQTRSEIGQRQAEAAAKPKTAKASMAYADLLDKNTQDLENNIQNSGSSQLQGAWQDANDTYANNVAPYKARDIMPLLDKSDTTDLTTALMRPENAMIVQHMPQNIRNLVAYQELNKSLELKNGEVETNASKLAGNFGKLYSQNQGAVERLLPPETINNLINHNTIYNATKTAVPYVYPPATGFQLKKFYEQAKPYLLGGLAGGLGFIHPALAMSAFAVPPALLGLNRGFAKTMTNPALRQAYGAVTQDASGNIIPNALARRQFINQALPYKPKASGNSLNRFNPMIANALSQGNQTQ